MIHIQELYSMVLWSEEYLIGIREIDKQHKKFVELAKPLFEADEELSREEIRELLYALREYMKFHFEDEEKYMKKVSFPELDEHILQHKRLVDELALVVQTPAKLPVIQSKIKVIVKKFVKHIRDEDHKIKLFIESSEYATQTQEEIFEL